MDRPKTTLSPGGKEKKKKNANEDRRQRKTRSKQPTTANGGNQDGAVNTDGAVNIETNESGSITISQLSGVTSGSTSKRLDENDEHESWVCTACTISYANEDSKVIVCDRCESYTCADCLNISDELYEFIGRDDVFWCCKDCKTVVNDMLDGEKNRMKGILPSIQEPTKIAENIALQTIAERLDRLEISLSKRESEQHTPVVDEKWINDITTQTVNKCLAQLSGVSESESVSTEANGMEVTSQPSTWATIAGKNNASQTNEIVANFREIMKEQRVEQKQKEDREQNIIIFRLKESDSESFEERRKHDENLFLRLCAEPLELAKIKIKNVTRLGKKQADKGPRPMKVSLEDIEDKHRIMARLTKLREAEDIFRNIGVANDLTKEDRDLVRAKVEEAKEKTKNESAGGLYVFRVRGPPWNLQIKRFQARGATVPIPP